MRSSSPGAAEARTETPTPPQASSRVTGGSGFFRHAGASDTARSKTAFTIVPACAVAAARASASPPSKGLTRYVSRMRRKRIGARRSSPRSARRRGRAPRRSASSPRAARGPPCPRRRREAPTRASRSGCSRGALRAGPDRPAARRGEREAVGDDQRGGGLGERRRVHAAIEEAPEVVLEDLAHPRARRGGRARDALLHDLGRRGRGRGRDPRCLRGAARRPSWCGPWGSAAR